jgi:hypothetical protein
MTEMDLKPLNWAPEQGVGYTVIRRPDGGMHFIFKDTSHDTLQHWRAFSEKHLLDSDRLTRNLYDLRQLTELPDEAIQVAIQVNSDPSTRNIRLAVVVGNQSIRQSVEKIEDLTIPAGLELSIFNSIEEAEIWLDRPLTLLV